MMRELVAGTALLEEVRDRAVADIAAGRRHVVAARVGVQRAGHLRPVLLRDRHPLLLVLCPSQRCLRVRGG